MIASCWVPAPVKHKHRNGVRVTETLMETSSAVRLRGGSVAASWRRAEPGWPLEGLTFDVVISDVVDYLLLSAAGVAKRRAPAEDAGFGARRILGRRAAEKAVVLDALLPEILALVAPFEIELDHVFVITLQPMRGPKEKQ